MGPWTRGRKGGPGPGHNIYHPDIPIALVGEEIMEYTGSIVCQK